MNDLEFERILSDPAARIANYKALVQAHYTRISHAYRQIWGDSYHLALFSGSQTRSEALVATEQMLAEEGRFRPEMKVLDIGCGLGGPALTIAKHSGAHVTGIDIVERHIQIARQRSAECGLSDQTSFGVADGMNLPFANDSFDRVYVFEAGCHMPDKAEFCKECARVLSPGGLFLGLDWMRKVGLTPQEALTYIEPICRCFAVPYMITLVELSRYLAAAGLDSEVLADVSVRGNIMRNFEPLGGTALGGNRPVAFESTGLPQQLLRDGGLALVKAVGAGAFIFGYWRARKLGAPRVV